MIFQNNISPLSNALVNHFLPNKVLDRRWLLAIPFVIALVLYVVFQTVSMTNQGGSLPTIWDMVISVVTNHHIVHHGFMNIFIYLVSGIGLTEQLETQVLLRVGSRKDWLKAWIICLLACIALYMSLILLSTLIAALPFVQFSWQWERFIQFYLEQEGLPTRWLQISPSLTVMFMVILMCLAWVFIGVSIVLTTILTQRPALGFLYGLILNYSAFIITQIDTLWLEKIWLSRYMFLWSNHVIDDSILFHFMVSCLYWIVLNTIGLVALWMLTKKLDFTTSYHAE